MNSIIKIEQPDDYRAPLILGVVASVIVQTINVAMGGGVAPRWAYFGFSILAFASLSLAAFRVRAAPKFTKLTCGIWLVFGYAATAVQLACALNM
jgi:hypothetical protein